MMCPTGDLEPARAGPLRAAVQVDRGSFRLQADLDVAPGQVLAVLGPNGAGKTTLLRALAGLVAMTAGSIHIGEDVWEQPSNGIRLPPEQRSVGVVFQDYRLFPHLSVLDNVAFPGRARGMARRAAREDAARLLGPLRLTELAHRRPAQLSGGQAQRVALARALATEPQLLLLDEPLAALDARTRLEVRGELRLHLTGFGGPSIVITHDPLEAMILADRILVLEEGHVVQEGAPSDIAARPATDYVARLMGLNLYTGTVVDRATRSVQLDSGGVLHTSLPDPSGTEVTPLTHAGTRMIVVVAPSAISLHTHEPDPGSARNVWTGCIDGMQLLTDRVRILVDGRPSALVDITPAAVAHLELRAGQQVWLTAKATEVIAYPDLH